MDTVKRLARVGRTVSLAYIDVYERVLVAMADAEERVSEAAEPAWIAAAGRAHAIMMREIATAYASAARDVVR